MFKNRILIILSLAFFLFFSSGLNHVLAEGSAVEFSGKVKKVMAE